MNQTAKVPSPELASSMYRKVRELQDENARLREALEKVFASDNVQQAIDVARAALEAT